MLAERGIDLTHCLTYPSPARRTRRSSRFPTANGPFAFTLRAAASKSSRLLC